MAQVVVFDEAADNVMGANDGRTANDAACVMRGYGSEGDDEDDDVAAADADTPVDDNAVPNDGSAEDGLIQTSFWKRLDRPAWDPDTSPRQYPFTDDGVFDQGYLDVIHWLNNSLVLAYIQVQPCTRATTPGERHVSVPADTRYPSVPAGDGLKY
eukprot:SAG31_NODE_21542_length_546_cov_30.671141_1_plen_154_part_01